MDLGLKHYVIKRIVISLILIWAVATVNFIIFNMMPGTSLARYVAKLSVGGGQEQIEKLRETFGLTKPLHDRYMIYIVNMFTWNFGYSFEVGDVTKAIARALPNTLLLMGVAEFAAVIFGILLGVIAAYKRGTWIDSTVVIGSLLTYSVPVFWLGWIVLNIFAMQLGWFQGGGLAPWDWGLHPPENFVIYIAGRLWCIVLPALTLFIFLVGGWILLTRATMLEAITEDYVVTAQAKGLKTRTILFKHVLKNASLPLVTSVALTLGFLITGAIITETVFSYGGMGSLTIDAIATTDVPILQTVFFITGVLVIIFNFLADLIYGIIDPRIKYG